MTDLALRHAVALLIAATCYAIIHAQPRYRFDAAGRPARIDQRWELRRTDGKTNSIVSSLARCGSKIFLADASSDVHWINAEESTPALHHLLGIDQGIGRPTALAVDCSRGRLYVVNSGPRTVMEIESSTGAVLRTQPIQRDIYEARSARLVDDSIYVGGLWNSDTMRPLPKRDVATFFASTSIGQRISLASGKAAPAFGPYEERCIAAGACTYADLDVATMHSTRRWVATQGLSTRVALHDASGARVATHDVRSPKFQRDGTELAVATTPDITARWQSRNSLIRRVFAVDDLFLTVHTLNDIQPGWVFGEQTQYLVFLNVFAPDGTGLVSDIRLPDLPIGRDESNLYVADYGVSGRQSGADQITLLRIAIRTGADSVH